MKSRALALREIFFITDELAEIRTSFSTSDKEAGGFPLLN
jgi:hypothetical protein